MKVGPRHLFLIVPFLLFIVYRFLGFDGLYGMDSYEYYRYAGEIRDYLLGSNKPGFFFWPHGFPLLVAVLGLIVPLSFAGQMVSLCSLYGIFYFSNKLIELLYEQRTSTYFFLLISLLLAPYFLRNSLQVMADLPSVFFFTGAVYFAIKFYKSPSNMALFWCSFMAAYACFIRLGSAIPLIPVFAFTAYQFIRKFRLSYVVGFMPLLLIGGLYFFFKVEADQFGTHHFIDEWSFSNYFERTFYSNEKHKLATLSNKFPNLVYYFGMFFYPGFFFLNIVLFLLGLKKAGKIKETMYLLLASSILLNTLFLSGVTYQGDRYLFPVYPLFVVLLFPAFRNLYMCFGKEKKVIIVFLILVQLTFGAKAIYPFWQQNQLEKKVVESLKSYQGKTLYCFEMDLALQQRQLEFNYENLWLREYTIFEEGALVLFNESKFASRYEGKPPMNNWNKLKKNYSLKEIHSFDANWKVYRIGK